MRRLGQRTKLLRPGTFAVTGLSGRRGPRRQQREASTVPLVSSIGAVPHVPGRSRVRPPQDYAASINAILDVGTERRLRCVTLAPRRAVSSRSPDERSLGDYDNNDADSFLKLRSNYGYIRASSMSSKFPLFFFHVARRPVNKLNRSEVNAARSCPVSYAILSQPHARSTSACNACR